MVNCKKNQAEPFMPYKKKLDQIDLVVINYPVCDGIGGFFVLTMFGAIVMFYITFKHRCLIQILHHCCHKDKMSRRELISFYKSGEITKGDKALTIR